MTQPVRSGQSSAKRVQSPGEKAAGETEKILKETREKARNDRDQRQEKTLMKVFEALMSGSETAKKRIV